MGERCDKEDNAQSVPRGNCALKVRSHGDEKVDAECEISQNLYRLARYEILQ